jgi:hypothetical protein
MTTANSPSEPKRVITSVRRERAILGALLRRIEAFERAITEPMRPQPPVEGIPRPASDRMGIGKGVARRHGARLHYGRGRGTGGWKD